MIKQSGVALIYVLVVISAFTLYMLNRASASQVKNNRLALEFSIAQTNSILNAVYSYRLRSGEWPIDNDDNCELPDEFLNFSDDVDMINGWGFEIEPLDDCDEDSEFGFVQSVPDEYVSYFINTIGSAEDNGQQGGPDGTTEVEVTLNQYGGADHRFQIGELGDYILDPYSFVSHGCGEAQESYVYGIDGICGGAQTDYWDGYIPSTYSGFRIRIDGDEFFYDMYDTESTTNENGQINGYEITAGWGGQFNDEGLSSDGHRFANERCPINNGSRIKTLVLSWCE